MCLSVPVKILSIKKNKAIIDINGRKKAMAFQLTPEVKKNDFCLVSNGFIIKKISPQEAKETLKIFKKEGK